MAKKIYQVESPVRHDGQDYLVGATIDLEDKEATGLLDVKAISLSSGSSKANTAPADEAERIAAIVAAIEQLDVNDKSLWAKNGTPKTEAIAAITGWPVSAADRDMARTQQ